MHDRSHVRAVAGVRRQVGVTAQDLLDFVDTHGEDVEFMRDLWTEVETRMTKVLEQNARDEENEENEGPDGSEQSKCGDAGVSP